MRIEYARQAVKEIEHQDRQVKQRLKTGIEGLPDGDVKPLQGMEDHFRLRVGAWRILFTYVDANTIRIERIATRGDVYKGV